MGRASQVAGQRNVDVAPTDFGVACDDDPAVGLEAHFAGRVSAAGKIGDDDTVDPETIVPATVRVEAYQAEILGAVSICRCSGRDDLAIALGCQALHAIDGGDHVGGGNAVSVDTEAAVKLTVGLIAKEREFIEPVERRVAPNKDLTVRQ